MAKLTGRTLQMPLVAGCCSIIVATYVFSSLRSARELRDTEENKIKRKTSAHYSSSGGFKGVEAEETQSTYQEKK